MQAGTTSSTAGFEFGEVVVVDFGLCDKWKCLRNRYESIEDSDMTGKELSKIINHPEESFHEQADTYHFWRSFLSVHMTDVWKSDV